MQCRGHVDQNGLRLALFVDSSDAIRVRTFGVCTIVKFHRVAIEAYYQLAVSIYVVSLWSIVALCECYVVEHQEADIVFVGNVVDCEIFRSLGQIYGDVLENTSANGVRIADLLEIFLIAAGSRVEYFDLLYIVLRLSLEVVYPKVDLLRCS